MKNSLLADFEELESSMDPIKEIKQFIKANYKIDGELQISEEPNENGKYEVSVGCICTVATTRVVVKNTNITSLTNGLFEWKYVVGSFTCYDCKSLTSLEGAPKKVGDYFSCANCSSLTNLEGAPKETGYFDCFNCGKQFTKDDVKKNCSVRRTIFI